MVKAFVFGKFLPFHKGHEVMIRFALTKCDFLTVLVCASDTETLEGSIRKNWIDKTFPESENIEVRVFDYLESELPNSSVSSQEISKKWSVIFKELLPDYELLITSEEYGNYVAGFMGINHISFDPLKEQFPISATNIRANLVSTWNSLPNSVKSDLAIKVVLLGTESTGKTTLTKKLAKHYNCTGVLEAGRELIENSNSFQLEDLQRVASEHAKRIEKAAVFESPLVIIDTDVHITMSYAKFMFNEALEVDEQIYESNKADLYLFLNNDVTHVQDGTRLSKEDRDALDVSHREILNDFGIQFTEICGDWGERYANAVTEINRLIYAKSTLNWT